MKAFQSVDAGFVDVSERGLVELRGLDALDLLHRITTNDLLALEQGAMARTVFTNEKGRIVEVAAVLNCGDDRILVVGTRSDRYALVNWVNKFIIMEDVVAEELSSRFTHILLLATAEQRIRLAPRLEAGEGRWMSVPELGPSALVFQERWPNAELVHLLVAIEQREEMNRLLESYGCNRATKEQFEVFRVAAGIPSAPSELSTEYNPLEANLHDLMSFTKGCYVGQEVIARLDTYRKVQRRLVRCTLDEVPQEIPTAVYDDLREVGILTSTAVNGTAHTVYGLGYINTKALAAGSQMHVRKEGKHLPLRIAAH